jgi:histidinol dehydrogenase
MKIYTVEEAQQTILERRALNRIDYSPVTIERTEEFFGKGMTPPQAVELILRSVEEEGDQAIRKWSALLDRYDGDVIAIHQDTVEQAWSELAPGLQKAMQTAAERVRAFYEKQPMKWVGSWASDSHRSSELVYTCREALPLYHRHC